MIERRPGGWPPPAGGCGLIRNTASRDAPKLATSSQYTTRIPGPARSSPAAAGPATAPSWNSAWNIALAVETSDRRTRFGIMALRPELSKPLSPAVSAGNTNSGHSAEARSALRARPALLPAISTSTTSSTRRRSTASATEPPISDPSISGASAVSDTSPTSSDERVSSYTW